MLKNKKCYVCQNCGNVSLKWIGYCKNCGGWNTYEEDVVLKSAGLNFGLELNKKSSFNRAVTLNLVDFNDQQRFTVEMAQFNSLMGGGIVCGSLCLLGGCPGIGKSTLLLQVCGSLCKKHKVLYVSGEESCGQIKIRAERLKIKGSNLFVLSEFDMQSIVGEIEKLKPEIVVVDSIQTISSAQIASSCGSVTQVKQCTYILQKIAKEKNIAIIIVGHVNKEGSIAGPKILEHIVDVVLSFEGESKFLYRVLRVVKNRFGSSNEMVVFEMNEEGLSPVLNPSKILLSERPKKTSGSCICCLMEGSRPIFVEIQAIVAKSNLVVPRRMSSGFDYSKLVLIIAVLEKRVGFSFKNLDCYVNVVGSLKLDGVFGFDLALILALVSSLKNIPVGDDVVAFGEVGLAGEVRSVNGLERAIVEAKKLGFQKFFVPKSCLKKLQLFNYNVKIIAVESVNEAVSICFN